MFWLKSQFLGYSGGPGIQGTFMMKFSHKNVFVDGDRVSEYELPVKTVVIEDSVGVFAWEDWQYGLF